MILRLQATEPAWVIVDLPQPRSTRTETQRLHLRCEIYRPSIRECGFCSTPFSGSGGDVPRSKRPTGPGAPPTSTWPLWVIRILAPLRYHLRAVQEPQLDNFVLTGALLILAPRGLKWAEAAASLRGANPWNLAAGRGPAVAGLGLRALR